MSETTEFPPAERATLETLERRRSHLEESVPGELSDAGPSIFLVPNDDLLHEPKPEETDECGEVILQLSDHLIAEIRSQRELTQAERGELPVSLIQIDTREFLEDISRLCAGHEVAAGRLLRVDERAASLSMRTDPSLLGRVIINLTKNALEATPEGGHVTLSCCADEGSVEFSVHNPACIPRDVQLQLFQRSFSTKGSGRGLGTYSVQLLSEKYLSGRVAFETSDEAGTTFRARYPFALGPASEDDARV